MNEQPANNCKQIRESFPDYIEGKLDESRSLLIDEHLKECSECAKVLEELEDKVFTDSNSKAGEYDVKKIESRFARRIMTKLFSTALIAFVVLYAVFAFVLPLLFNKSISTKAEYVRYAVNDLIQFTIPGAKLKNIPNSGRVSVVNIYSLAEFDKKLTGGAVKTGKIDLAVPLYIGSSDFKMIWSTDNNGSDITFRFPQAVYKDGLDQQWNKLDKLKNGTRCQIAAYFEKPLTLSEAERLLNLIAGEDFNTWFAIDTGNALQDQHPERGLYYNVEWGFPMMPQLTPATADRIQKDEKGHTTTMSSTVPEHSVSVAAGKFKKEMKDFEKYSKVLGLEEFTNELIDTNKFLESSDIKIRGAILSASTENMLKLKDYAGLARIDIVNVEFDY